MQINDILNLINEDGISIKVLEIFRAMSLEERKTLLAKVDDIKKTEILLAFGKSGEFIDAFNSIDDIYMKKLVLLNWNDPAANPSAELVKKLEKYAQISQEFNSILNEEGRAIFLERIRDKIVKYSLYEKINNFYNRQTVIDSFINEVSDEISEEVAIAQMMIKDFLRDTYGEKYNKQMNQDVECVFSRTDVKLVDLDEDKKGEAHSVTDEILISKESDKGKILYYLIHEYGHLLSGMHSKMNIFLTHSGVEEGMQDLFAELVINHELEKNGKDRIRKIKSNIELPFVSQSIYDNESSIVRTCLYPLETRNNGEDLDAVLEYELGKKEEFYKKIFGREKFETFTFDPYGNRIINMNLSEEYNSHKEEFKVLNRDSIYLRRNNLLPMLIVLARANMDRYDSLKNATSEEIENAFYNGKSKEEISEEEKSDFKFLMSLKKLEKKKEEKIEEKSNPTLSISEVLKAALRMGITTDDVSSSRNLIERKLITRLNKEENKTEEKDI